MGIEWGKSRDSKVIGREGYSIGYMVMGNFCNGRKWRIIGRGREEESGMGRNGTKSRDSRGTERGMGGCRWVGVNGSYVMVIEA